MSDGVRLCADEYGEPGERGLLLVHGGGQTRHAWAATASQISARGWHCLAYDMRGHGDSDWDPQGEYGMDSFVADLSLVCSAFVRPPVVVGASLGGMSALLLAEEHPVPPLAAVVLVDVVPRVKREGVADIARFMGQRMEQGFASLDEAADYVAAYLPQRKRRINPNGLRKNLSLQADGRYRWKWDPALINGEFGRRLQAENYEEHYRRSSEAARACRVPLMLVRGGASEVVDEAAVEALFSDAPQLRYLEVPEAGHMVAGDNNDAFCQALSQFLDDFENQRREKTL